MVDGVLIGALVMGETLGYRRARYGRPPSRPRRLVPSAFVALGIHIGFHAAATAAPSTSSAIAFVLAGWTTFFIWWQWVARAPESWNFDEGEDGGGGGGGGPGRGGPQPDDSKPGGGGLEIDWDALEREMSDFIDDDRQLAGAR